MVGLVEDITQNLEKLNIDIEKVETKHWEQLKKIETVLTEAFKVQEEYADIIKNNKPSINNVASKSKIARQTIYNNVLLKKYIEFRISSYNEHDPSKRNERLLERISELENKVKAMTDRDINAELMRRKISLLESNVKNLKKENKELHEKYNSLKQNNKKNTMEKRQNTSNVTDMPILK